jgi:hypothetical protein
MGRLREGVEREEEEKLVERVAARRDRGRVWLKKGVDADAPV